MKCKNKFFNVEALKQTIPSTSIQKVKVQLIITNDDVGKTITVTDGTVGFTFPADDIAKYLQ